ncbi:MAG: cytochrome c3 family protein [Deltaproteobacteria bacterium]|nr:cytochrome c3 family protein [Deltaproteobacteria bacterium]
MKKLMILFVALTLVTFAAMTAIADNKDKGPTEVKLPARMGEVTFQHAKHQERVEDCTTCHHAGVEAGACRSCHGEKAEAPKAKKVFHKLCRSCHKGNAGPTKCKACHTK